MFKKPFKQKSQIHVRSSEKKKFISELKTLFPTLTDEDINAINISKDSLIKIKITTVKDENIEIYGLDKVPLLFDLIDIGLKLPTVFMCWKFPHILPCITIENFLLNKLQNGADLFYPGVVIQGLLSDATDFKINKPIYINLTKNKAAMAVGISLVNKEDILSCSPGRQSGKVVKIYHIIGDSLYKFHPEPNIPQMGIPNWLQPSNSNTEIAELLSCGNLENCNEKNETNCNEPSVNTSNSEKTCDSSDKEKLLEYCFLKALKTVPKTSYPILPATFYANYVLTSLPNGEELNIKKTKWKKFSTFLQEKSVEGLIKLEQIQRGEYTIAAVESNHKSLKEFIDPYNDKQISVEPPARDGDKPSVLQVFSVSAATVPFFSKFGLKKNDEVTRTNVKVYLNDYVKRENLIMPDNMENVKLDPILHQIIKSEEVISRADLLSKMLEKMSIRYKISSTPNIVYKGKMPFVDFEVCTRTGNKKVTLISNLESYGVNIANFSKELQQKAAAHTTIITPTVPDKKGPQIQIQGNQILIAVNILKEKYNINEKFMRGLDKAPKMKKKGK